jgi:hypothetical protein
MQLMWGDDLSQETQGLDILGVRGLDQNLEAALVNGITTISIRARYLTILPWAIGEFFADEVASGATSYDAERLQNHLARVEYLALAATVADPASGGTSGLLGSVAFSAAMHVLRAGEPIEFPAERASAMLGTYFGPCRALGILADAPRGSPVAISITPRGRDIWLARNAAIRDAGLVKALIRDGGQLNLGLAQSAVPWLSLNRLDRNSEEEALLRGALTEDWRTAPAAPGPYERFNQTVAMLRVCAASAPLRAESVIADKYREAVEEGARDPTVLAWAEYEWRGRLHFALETMFSAICQTLSGLGEASLEDIVTDWRSRREAPDVLAAAWSGAAAAWETTAAGARSSTPEDLFLGKEVPQSDIVALEPHARALFSFALATSLAAQTASLRADNLFCDRGSVGDAALRLVSSAGAEPFEVALGRLAQLCVEAHLKTTYRKMANGQNCSLRFFENGPRLAPTGLPAHAGRSNIRLRNVIGILAEAGVEGMGRVA